MFNSSYTGVPNTREWFIDSLDGDDDEGVCVAAEMVGMLQLVGITRVHSALRELSGDRRLQYLQMELVVKNRESKQNYSIMQTIYLVSTALLE